MPDTQIGNRHFGAWLRSQRKSRGLTQEELGLKLFCSGYAISKIELGERRPSRQTIELLAGLLGVPEGERESFFHFARNSAHCNQETAARHLPGTSEVPWRSLNAPPLAEADFPYPGNLPAPLTRFVGRERELRLVGERLMRYDVRLLTLTGPPGVGKTRLSLEVARALVGAFEHGVFLLELAPLRDPALLPSAIAAPLGVRETPGQPLAQTLMDHLKGRHILLVLDNFEHILAGAVVVSRLLEACPELKVLATSREPLNLYPEHRFEVAPLGLPGRDQVSSLSPQALLRYEAVRLFEERAKARFFDFAVTARNARGVAEVCLRLGGLPLALELAVANVAACSPEGIAGEIQTHLPYLSSNASDVPLRHQTLEGAIAWSYNLLDEAQKCLFRRLAVFSDSCTVEAVEAVYSHNEGKGIDVADGLHALVSKSLVRIQGTSRGCDLKGSRFSMLETIRQFAYFRADENGEVEELQRRHAHYFAELVPKKWSGVPDAEIAAWYDSLEIEHNNLRAALAWSTSSGAQSETETALRLATSLSGFWRTRGYLTEAQRWLSTAIEGACEAQAPLMPAALYELAYVHWMRGDAEECKIPLRKALELYTGMEDRIGLASCLALMGQISLLPGSCVESELSEAQRLLEQSLHIFREARRAEDEVRALSQLGEIARARGRYREAGQLYREVMAMAEKMDWKGMVAVQLHNLGHVALHDGDHERAAALFAESLYMARDIGHQQLMAICMAGLAGVSGARRQPERAAVLFGVADHLLHHVGASLNLPDKTEYDRNLAAARSQLHHQAWRDGHGRGMSMRVEQAVGYALGEG